MIRNSRKPRSVAPAYLLALGLVVLLTMAGCGGGGSSTSSVTPVTPVTPSSIAGCADGTVASYLGTSCSQITTVYNWTSYSCTSTPSSICTALGTNGSNVAMHMDPNGPYTILVGQTNAWNVAAGQSVDVVISGTVYGASKNGNWPHFQLPGQTGDGTEENKTTVACATAAECTANSDGVNLDGVSDILCSAATAVNCVSPSTVPPQYTATFNPAPSTSPYAMTIEITLNGGTSGSATLYSVGTHLQP